MGTWLEKANSLSIEHEVSSHYDKSFLFFFGVAPIHLASIATFPQALIIPPSLHLVQTADV